jgi:hypothetical protein
MEIDGLAFRNYNHLYNFEKYYSDYGFPSGDKIQVTLEFRSIKLKLKKTNISKSIKIKRKPIKKWVNEFKKNKTFYLNPGIFLPEIPYFYPEMLIPEMSRHFLGPPELIRSFLLQPYANL